ncbi:rano class II histocompatibility antigen, A beta chain-like isoform X1 [Alosa sapidissima]|uniref:rano class II histocompatibility antigen, A beta chain-like isoform X1 n=2 Tax=Alosa sapidissima TaxID=34773 RepID=UPI001C083C37|nr:rano class II histocompatibility antigen, A beta chain-like isoform X1 [Alosa sapidissima]
MQPSSMFGSFLLILSYLSGRADAYSEYFLQTCHSSKLDLSDMVYVESYYFNRIKYLVFNSTYGKFVGYTEVGERLAEAYNSNEAFLTDEQNLVNRYCNPAVRLYKTYGIRFISEPRVKLSLGKPFSDNHPGMLVCSAYDFYPKMIHMSWYRNGQKVTSDVLATEELADGDWFYQSHSHLEFTPKTGEKITCVVEHISFNKSREFVWDSSMLESERNKVAIGAAGLVLGLVVCTAGLLYYRKKSQGRIMVPPAFEFITH